MPVKSVVITNKADKQISKLPTRIQIRVATALDKLKSNPLAGTKLEGELSKSYKLKVGDYRIVYSFYTKEKVAVILKVEHRQGVYR